MTDTHLSMRVGSSPITQTNTLILNITKMSKDRDLTLKLNEIRPQKFYFNENGELVVESNNGVWVDGTQYTKMYGTFSCNARTMCQIINQLKGIKVETVGIEEKVLEEIKKEVTEAVDACNKEIEKYKKDANYLQDKINEYNELPWWKRMFKKVEVK